jgi:hypothetical protein
VFATLVKLSILRVARYDAPRMLNRTSKTVGTKPDRRIGQAGGACPSNQTENIMQAYRRLPGDNIDGLRRVDLPGRELAAGAVRIPVHAVSLNYRDLMVARGNYLVSVEDPVIRCADGAGEVLAVGPGVSRWQQGDRVGGGSK